MSTSLLCMVCLLMMIVVAHGLKGVLGPMCLVRGCYRDAKILDGKTDETKDVIITFRVPLCQSSDGTCSAAAELGDRSNKASESEASSTELSEFFCTH